MKIGLAIARVPPARGERERMSQRARKEERERMSESESKNKKNIMRGFS